MNTIKGFESFSKINEHQEQQNYMFFGNLKTIKRLVDEMLEMDEAEVDNILSNGHNWALDHIATSRDDVEEVFNFLANHNEPEEHHGEMPEEHHEEKPLLDGPEYHTVHDISAVEDEERPEDTTNVRRFDDFQ